MFNKSKGQETWKSPKTIYRGTFSVDYANRSYAEIKKVKIYGYRFENAHRYARKNFYLYRKGDHKSMSSGKVVRGAKTWQIADASLCDKDKNFVIEVLISKYKNHIKEMIKKHQEYIDNEAERITKQKIYTQHRKEVISELTKVLDNNLVSIQDYHWSARWADNKVEVSKRPLHISEETQEEKTTYYL